MNERSGGPVKPRRSARRAARPVRRRGRWRRSGHVEQDRPQQAVPEGLVLRYGGFYGPGASESSCWKWCASGRCR